MANIAINLWGYDFLQQWKIQINIPPIIETSHKPKNASKKNIKRYYQNQLHTNQVVHKQDTTALLSKLSIVLTLKWLTDKIVWVEQLPLTSAKMQALEQLVQEQCTEELASPWNSPTSVI